MKFIQQSNKTWILTVGIDKIFGEPQKTLRSLCHIELIWGFVVDKQQKYVIFFGGDSFILYMSDCYKSNV